MFIIIKKKRRCAASHKKGFTLIELMVIISVMLILSAMAIPSFQSMSDRARVHAVKEVLIEIRLAQNLYKHDYGTYAALANKAELLSKLGKYVKLTQLLFGNVYNQDLVYPGTINGEDGFTITARARDKNNTPITATETKLFPK